MADTKARIVLTAENRAASAINQLRGQLGSLSAQAAGLNKSFGAFGAVFGGAFAGLTLTAFIKSTAQSIDKLNDLKDATGASIENLSALEDVGARTGTSFESVSSSLVKFNKVLSDAKPGTDAERIFTALGLSLEELKRQDPAEALRLTAVALSNFADNGDKARAVQELFGKSVKDAAPFLNDLAKQTRLVGTVTTEQAEAAEKFNQQLAALTKNGTDFARSLVSSVVPALNSFFAALNQLGGRDGGVVALLGLDEVSLVTRQTNQLNAEVTRVGDAVGRLSEALRRDPGNELLAGRLDKARAKLKELQIQAAASSEQLKQLVPAAPTVENGGVQLPGRGGAKRSLVVPGAAEKEKADRAAGAARQSEAERYLESLQKQAEKTQQLNTLEQALVDIQKGRIEGLTPKLREQILAQAALNDTLGKTLEVESRAQDFRRSELADGANVEKALTDARIQSYEDLQKAAAGYFEATRTPQERLIEDIKEQQRLLELLGEQYADTFGRAAAQAVEKFQATQKTVEKTDSTAKDLGLTFASSFEKAIVGGQGLSDVIKGLGQDIQQILARKLVTEPLANAVTGALGGLTGAGGGGFAGILSGLASVFGFAKGGAFNGQLQAFASGGVVTSPTLFKFAQGGSFRAGVMGEAGPEAILPLTRGAGGKLGVRSEAPPQQRAVTVTINQQFAPGTNTATVNQAAARAAQAVQRATARGFN